MEHSSGDLIRKWHYLVLCLICISLGSVISYPFFQRKEEIFDAAEHQVEDLDKNISAVGGGVIVNDSITWSNKYGSLTVTPHTSTNIIRQTQYAEFVSNITNELDVAFRFNNSLNNKNIWIWKNISHNVSIPDYDDITDNYTL